MTNPSTDAEGRDEVLADAAPRPWSLDHREFREGVIRDANDKQIVECCNRLPHWHEDKANAELICRAVNAHEALVKALNIFLGGDDRFQVAVGGNPIAVDKMLAEARAALSLANAQSGLGTTTSEQAGQS